MKWAACIIKVHQKEGAMDRRLPASQGGIMGGTAEAPRSASGIDTGRPPSVSKPVQSRPSNFFSSDLFRGYRI